MALDIWQSPFLTPTPAPRSGRPAASGHAFDDESAVGRVGEPDRQYFLVFGQVVSAFHRRGVCEPEDDDPLQLWPAFKQFGGTAPGQKAAPILRDCGGYRRPIGLHRGRIPDLDFSDEIGRLIGSSR